MTPFPLIRGQSHCRSRRVARHARTLLWFSTRASLGAERQGKMDFTETTVLEFFRKAGQSSAGYRLMEFLRAENLMLVPVIELAALEEITAQNGKKKVRHDR